MQIFGNQVITIDTSARLNAFDTEALLVGSYSLRNVDTIAPTLQLCDVESGIDSTVEGDTDSTIDSNMSLI